jgi:sterol desaturase/sphingolipid hydroxylase (fatty acid hydroxylase superfamily)
MSTSATAFLVGSSLALLAAALEALVGRARHRLRETASNLAHFIGEAALTGAAGVGGLATFALVQPFAPVAWPSGVAGGIAAFLVYDLVLWLQHWLQHRVNILWALHHVHHQPTVFNFTVALRDTWLKLLEDAPVFVVLALLGLPFELVLAFQIARSAWGLFQHTQLVGRLGPLELWLATPSAHRVHHASNARYRDKNFGAVTILWDRLFGCYRTEDEVARFGTSDGWEPGDPLVDSIGPLACLWASLRAAPSWRARLVLLLGPPTAYLRPSTRATGRLRLLAGAALVALALSA